MAKKSICFSRKLNEGRRGNYVCHWIGPWVLVSDLHDIGLNAYRKNSDDSTGVHVTPIA